MAERARFRVTGTVQGVGFRPFVYRHARALGLTGFVRNDPAGVLIEVEGPPAVIDQLAAILADDPPPLARVTSIVRAAVRSSGREDGFRIDRTELDGGPTAPVGVDAATCDDCRDELFDPSNRRHRYPFTTCTNCGPRYTIVAAVPYDRPTTTMARFVMCPACQAEYDDPADRRFHAQTNACPDCGPALAWRRPDGTVVATADGALVAAVDAVAGGGIIALKGVGGYHLVVDALNRTAVGELRRRKARDDKPFAVMVPDLEGAASITDLSGHAVAALTSPARPIVLVPKRPDGVIASGVAPGLAELGIMLPYSPLHHLLLTDLGRPLVVTSGNLSDEPIAHEDDDAVARLGPLADGLLTHDRSIHVRCDDSVVRAGPTRVQALRRSRGLAPQPVPLPAAAACGATVLALGAELKSTVALARDGAVVASHHVGDLEHLASYRSFRQAIDHLLGLYDATPDVVAHDRHPEYLSTKLAGDLDLPLVSVQHHHAHVAACLTDHGRSDPVVALAFDGLGYGLDGDLWGGEVLVGGIAGVERVGHLREVVMPGGVGAIREPWRMAVAWGRAAGVPVPMGDEPNAATVVDLVDRGAGRVTTSMGRLLDGLAALVTGRRRVSYEAQAVVELEALARASGALDRPGGGGWADLVTLRDEDGSLVLDPADLVARVVAAVAGDEDRAAVAAGVHAAVAAGASGAAVAAADTAGLGTVVLTGGVFQNAVLSELVERSLTEQGLEVLVHERIPPNDGGISIGQAAIASAAATA